MKKIFLAIAAIIVLIIGFMGVTLAKIKSETSMMTAIKTSEVIPGIYAIQDEFSNMYLVENNGKYIAIDACKNIHNVSRALDELQIKPQDIETILLTHTDQDHIGAIGLFKNANIYISTEEEQMVNGTTKRMFLFSNKLKPAHNLLDNNEVIDINGITIKGILVEGHTPGSMCYQINDKYLFTGDALRLNSGKVVPFNDFFNMDSKTAQESHSKIKNLSEVEYIFTAHYGYTNNYAEAFLK